MSNGQPRRLSIFGGLLWIIIGVLLLANNLLVNFPLWDLFHRYWPVLLILLGVAKLFDHFASQRTGQPPARLLTGGEVFLIIVLFVVGGAVAAGHQIIRERPDWEVRFPWYREFTFTEQINQAVEAGRAVAIELPKGNISVVAEDTNDIRVVANKKVLTANESAAQERAKGLGIEIAEAGNRYVIRPKAGAEIHGNAWQNLEVHLPKQTGVTVRTERGEVIVTGLAANLSIRANGGVEIRDVNGSVDAELDGDVRFSGVAGDVKVGGSCGRIEIADVQGTATVRCGFGGHASLRNIAKQVYFKSVRTELTAGSLPGRLEIDSGDMEIYDVPKDITLRTRNYDITLENIGGRIQVENQHGSVHLRLPKPPTEDVDITTEREDVELLLPANSTFEINAVSRKGEAESDFTGPELKVTDDDREGVIAGRIGTRGPQIRIKTSYGTVRLRKGQ